MQNNVCSDIFWYEDMLLHAWAKQMICFSIHKIHGKLWGDDIINSLICIFISTVQEMFHWKLKNYKFHIFLNFYPIYIKFHCSVQNILLSLLNQLKPGLNFSFNLVHSCHHTCAYGETWSSMSMVAAFEELAPFRSLLMKACLSKIGPKVLRLTGRRDQVMMIDEIQLHPYTCT